MARTAGTAVGRSGGEARSRSVNIARYLLNNGRLVSSNVFSKISMEEPASIGGAGSIEVKSLDMC